MTYHRQTRANKIKEIINYMKQNNIKVYYLRTPYFNEMDISIAIDELITNNLLTKNEIEVSGHILRLI